MDKIPNLEELLIYGDEYQSPNLIMSDYFLPDNSKKENISKSQNNSNSNLNENDISNKQNTGDEAEEITDTGEEASEENSNEIQSTSQNDEEQTQESSETPDSNSEEMTNNDENASEEKDLDEELKEDDFENELSEKEEQSTENALPEKEENYFDELINNYEEDNYNNQNYQNKSTSNTPSDLLNEITTTKIYKVLKKLVSMNYEKYQKGTYKYNKKEIVKHYLTNQKFKIIDDLVSPTFKPDIYVFDLSPSNNDSLDMYINAISSVAIKNSIIYLTFNSRILRKIEIKKTSPKGIDVNEIVNSNIQNYNNFICTIYDEYQSLYEELKNIKERKIYIFSDFDISSDISQLSLKNPEVVWFSTEKTNNISSLHQSFLYREFPTDYIGYYVETSDIEDIEKFIMEKDKNKYRRRIK